MRAALAEDNIAGDDELGGPFFCAQAFAGAGGGFVGAALGSVRGGAGEEKAEAEVEVCRGGGLDGGAEGGEEESW